MTIHQRLKALVAELQSPRLLRNQGNGNEIGYYIFDYDAEHEPIVEQFISELQPKLAVSQPLEDRNLLQRAFDLEAQKGNNDLAKTIKPMVRPDKVVEKIQELVQGNEDLIFITGVGASWPMMRSHTILNNLHPVLDRTPVVMFFPGSYDGQELRLFDTFKDDNYYRAFPLIHRRSDKHEY
jgi:thiamine pyrophosphate-dependent acetolactate synthase large subunit-like protein